MPLPIPSRSRAAAPPQSASKRGRHDTMPPNSFSRSVDLRLIQLVKEHPVLYNPRHPKYTDSDTREVTWQKIGDSLSRPAVEFAGIQCQIHYGDFQEDKHKPGFIENLREFLPEQYCSGWGIEKKVLKEYRKYQGLNELEAKHLYTKTARALPTYGVTFFLVKEKQKDKKKLVPRLLGISAESILRLDETTKEVLQSWPLTHVKTYHAAQGEIFTLNFGDYSQKDYSVKTRDAYRIRDILEDYIDIIRKRMLAQYHNQNAESAYIEQDNVTSSTASTVQHISNNPMKVIEQSFVGPSKIVPFESGKEMCQGTQIVTVQQIVVSDRVAQNQVGAKGEVAMRGDMSMPFTRRLNRLNSNSVKIVTLLTEPTDIHIEDSRKIVDEMNADLPFIREGVKEIIEKQTSDEERKKLQEQMNELDELMRSLTRCTNPPTVNASEAADAAMKTADLTTQMYFSLDSRTKRRSRIISRSRKSFIEDDNTQRNVRKASFIAACTTALHTVDDAHALLDEKYTGPALDAQRTSEVEAALVDKLGKLNAAMAHYIMAHSDPNNIDYEAAVVSMNTIHELMPEFAKDAQALASTKDPGAQREILLNAKTLCDAAKKICSSAGLADKQKMDEASSTYAEVSGRLVFTFGKGRHSEKENELLDLADEVGAKISLLLMSAQELTQMAPSEAAAADVDAAGSKTAEAAKELISRVQMTAPTIHEPHCQSAVTAAAEALSSSVQQLALSWRPLVEPPSRHTFGEKMHHQVMELAQALDRLKSAYSGLGGDEDGDVFDGQLEGQERQRLKFINTLTANQKRWQQLDEKLNEPTSKVTVTDTEAEEAERRLSERLARLHAAMAALLAATSDGEQDYAQAEEAISTINELMPLLVQDSKTACANKDADARAAMMERIRLLCDASRHICGSADQTTPESRSDAIANFTNASGKLVFGITHRGNTHKQNQILEMSEEASQQVSQLLCGVRQVSERVGGATGTELEGRGAAAAAATRDLLTTAQVTAVSISEPVCQTALLASIDKLSSRGQELASTWKPLGEDPMHKKQVQGLDNALGQLENKLDALRSACQTADDIQPSNEQQKLQFVKTMSAATEQIQIAQKALDKPTPPPLSSDTVEAVEHRLSGRLGELNAAIAALLAATADRERPDYKSAEEAMKTISEILPRVVHDTQSSSASKDEATRAAMLDLLRELCEASRGVCAGTGENNTKGLNDAVSKFCDASGKLVYVVNPRSDANMENKIMGLSAGACNKASQLLSGVQQLAEGVRGERGVQLDTRGAAVADAAQKLITSAKLTAPSISEPHCKRAMLSSVDKVSSAARDLEESWLPLLKDPHHQQQAASLETPYKQLQDNLAALKKACQLADVIQTPCEMPREQQRLQFVKTMSGATEQIQLAQKALDKPIPPPLSSDKAAAVEHRLSGRLGELNAAIAALLAATANRENPDYKKAEQAMNTISELMPHVVQDTQSSSACKDEATRAAMLDLLRELCEASRGVLAGTGEYNTQSLNDAVSKFSNASGKLVYVVSPRVNADIEKQIMDGSGTACEAASQLLRGVQQLSARAGVRGERGVQLDMRGAALADAAQGLLQTAQVTAPSISEPHCKRAMLSSVDEVSSAARDLEKCWLPLLKDPQHQQEAAALHMPYKQLEAELEALKKVCLLADAVETPREQQRIQFVKTMSGATERIQMAQKALDKTIPPPLSNDEAAAVQHRLSARLGELNAAIAALLTATANRENPDYKKADRAIKTITELMPHVFQDTQWSCANREGEARAAMLDHIRQLCDASAAICATAHQASPQGMDDAVTQFCVASGALGAVSASETDKRAPRELQLVDLAMGAYDSAAELVSQLEMAPIPRERGEELAVKGSLVSNTAQALLSSTKVTAASIIEPSCAAALLSSVELLSAHTKEFEDTCVLVASDPRSREQGTQLQQRCRKLQSHIDAMRRVCKAQDLDVQLAKEVRNTQKLQFIQTKSRAEEQIQKTQTALDKPIPPPLSSDKAAAVQHRLSGRLGELNAAIAALLAATANREMPNYKTADKSMKTITELLPHIVQDTQSSSASKDEATRAAILDLLRELCEASRGVCAGTDTANTQGLSEAVVKFSGASGKLVYMVSPRVNPAREQKIMELSAGACNGTSQLLSGVQQLAEGVRGERGVQLDTRGAAVADAAQGLLQTAQVTAASISDPRCKASLLSAADSLSASCQELEASWRPLAEDPRHKQRVSALHQALQQLEAQLAALRMACDTPDQVAGPPKKTPPPPPTRSTPLSPSIRPSMLAPLPPGGTAVGASSSGKRAYDATKEFLDRLRFEESQALTTAINKSTEQPKPQLAVKTDDEKRMHQQFLQSVDYAEKTIRKAQEGLRSESVQSSAAISAGECLAMQARLQRNIALAAVQVAALLSANYADTIDYANASKSTDALPQLMNSIVEDGKRLSSTVNEESRKAFLEDMLQMCHSTAELCDAVRNHREKLNDAAIEFGDKSSKLLYIVSNDVDPIVEKEIISRAKGIGDSVAHISARAGEVVGVGGGVGGGAGSGVEALCAAGAKCQDGAGKLLYTAKLVAPSIYEVACQEALLSSADALSSDLRAFTLSWTPFSADKQHAHTIKELGKEAENLERIIDGLKSDVKGGRIGQRREIERLVVEDTPMRLLTLNIMEDAKKLSECSELSPGLKREYLAYSKKLSDALRAFDLAKARCKRTPHDTNKRRDLENAIQNLQMILLQSRPSRTDKQKSNIVDLRDFIDEVSAEADKLADATSGLKVPTAADKKTLQEIQANGVKISKAAYKLTHTDDANAGFDTSFNDILDVDQFGQECDEVIADINAQLKSMEDAKARTLMYSKILPLTESCNMLRFATKSGISAAKSVSLDSTLDDLDDVESRVIKSIVKDGTDNAGVTLRFAPVGAKGTDALAGAKLSRAVCSARGSLPRAPLTAYIASCAATTDTTDTDTRNRLLRHLYKLVHLLKTQTVTTSKRIATWQPIDDPEVATITQQILQEIENPESKFQPERSKVKKILDDNDLTQLLVPGPARVVGDRRQRDDKLTRLSTKLNSMCSTLTLSVASPESLSRSAHAASGAAVELAAVARGCKDNKDPVQCERIEESVNEMTFGTYGLLKTAEMSCQDPNNHSSKRRLLDACRSLNVAIDKLVRTTSGASPLAQECGSSTRALALAQTACPAAPAPTSALPYDQCCTALDDQQEIVYKLKSDQSMSRREFARSLHEVNEAVVKTTEISTQCAYLISISEQDSEIAKKGPVDVPRIQRSIEALQDSCMSVIGAFNVQQAKEETEDLKKHVDDFSRALDEAQLKVKDGGVKATLTRAKAGVTTSVTSLSDALTQQRDMEKVSSYAVNLLEEVNRAHSMIERCPLVPSSKDMSADAKAKCDEIANNSKSLLSSTLALVKEAADAGDDAETMTWVTFSATKTKLLDAYDALLRCIRTNGQRAGILEGSPDEEIDESETQSKTYLEVQVDLANKWLNRPTCKSDVKTTGQQAVRHVIDIANKMCEESKGGEREEIRHVIVETEELLSRCTLRYDHEHYSVLMDRIKELKKWVQRGVVTRVVEDFMHDRPLEDLELMVDLEQDEQKRKFLLERKIAELLAQLGRVTRTARFVADAGGSHAHSAELLQCSEQTELLAPMLVQAAQDRITSPNDQAAIEKYKSLLAKYAESISKVRTMCDRAVDPMDFVQTAGDTMQRMREESSAHNDVQKGHQTSEAIIKLANRSIEVSMSSAAVRRDPELAAALQAARRRILAATPAADTRLSRRPDWKESTAEVLRTTGEVESALGGENIFKKQPPANGANQQIYTVARDLHECVREWSSRDNEIVAVARRVAVHMARLSEYMETDKKQALISTSKSIVLESHEVAELAKKLAHECTDVRIKTNLLQTCERIPTISAQLKMLTTVKSSSLGHQGSAEDKEAMDMLVGNAQSLMISIQEVVKAAAGASVKIMSQRGPKLRWVRNNYY